MKKYMNRIIITVAALSIAAIVFLISTLINSDKNFSPPDNWITYNRSGILFSYPDSLNLQEEGLVILTSSSELPEKRVSLAILPVGKSEKYSNADNLCSSITSYYNELENNLPNSTNPFERSNKDEISDGSKINVTNTKVYKVNKREVCEYKVSEIISDNEVKVFSFFLYRGDEAYVVQATIMSEKSSSLAEIEIMDKVIKTIKIDDAIEFQEFIFPSPN